jgi:DNA-directed RNA polymerase II subunit RPB1
MESQSIIRGYSSITIPGVDAPLVVSSSAAKLPSNQVNIVNQTKPKPPTYAMRIRNRNLVKKLELNEIESIVFGLYSTEEIDLLSVANINSPAKAGPGSVRDLRLGVQGPNQLCDTCNGDYVSCPGHFGKIEIPKNTHPLARKYIIMILESVCNSCGCLLLSDEALRNNGIYSLSGLPRLRAIHALSVKNTCQMTGHCGMKQKHCACLLVPQKVLEQYKLVGASPEEIHNLVASGEYPMVKASCSPNPVYASLSSSKDNYFLAYTERRSNIFKFKTPTEIYDILNSISDRDAQILGFGLDNHPRNLIIERVLVIPYNARPDVHQGGCIVPDDLSSIYSDIVSTVLAIKNNTATSERDKLLNNLYYKISHLMKNDNTYSQGKAKIYSDVTKRLQGKQGHIRLNIMGKRVNFAGRTVIGPGAYLRVDQIGIPRYIANILTRPFTVSETNRAQLQAFYDNGLVKHITPLSGRLSGIRIGVSKSFKEEYPEYSQLSSGDIVERVLQDGDIVIVNRQPTLHKQSLLALYAVIIDDKIIRINLSITTPLNADFDGDEANIHIPQTLEAYAEAELLLGIYNNLLSGQSNRPIMGIVYDTLSGVDLLTKPYADFGNKYDEVLRIIDELNNSIASVADNSQKFFELNRELDGRLREKESLEEKLMLPPSVFENALLNISDAPQMTTLRERLAKYNIPWGSRQALISAAFPPDFSYKKGKVIIKDGVLVSGILSKKTLGTSSGSIINEMIHQLGSLITVDFMSDIQFIVRDFLIYSGLSVGVQDCNPDNPEMRKEMADIISDAMVTVLALTSKSTNKLAKELQEIKITQALGGIKQKADAIIADKFKADNSLIIMSRSGAKGTAYNAVNMSSLLGQQNVSGKRISSNLPGNRSLPIFQPNDTNPASRGFCYNSYSTGLSPSEFFFHAQAGREGLTDTAVNTSETGRLQHVLIKSGENIHIAHDGSVRGDTNEYIQFIYGEDGFDPARLSMVDIGGESKLFFRDLEQLAFSLNVKYGATNP